MYKDKKTLFYNGEILSGARGLEELSLAWRLHLIEQDSWQVIIVLPGVQVIPNNTFCLYCRHVKTVIMADTVRRIEENAFKFCSSLVFVKLSRNLEYIGMYAFECCKSLTSIFIPPSCREIGYQAFDRCSELIILSVPQDTQLGNDIIQGTSLKRASPFPFDVYMSRQRNNEVNAWIKNINRDSDAYSLHLLCCSYYPDDEQVYAFISDNGLGVMTTPNEIGVSPSQYLGANPYVDFHQQTLINRYILEKMGEIQP